MTNDRQRRARWQRIFGTDELPVKSSEPRWRVERDAFGRESSVLGYDLDASRLHWMARVRFSDYVSRKMGHTYRPSDIDNWLIKAAGCDIVNETADSWRERPFCFYPVVESSPYGIQFA